MTYYYWTELFNKILASYLLKHESWDLSLVLDSPINKQYDLKSFMFCWCKNFCFMFWLCVYKHLFWFISKMFFFKFFSLWNTAY